MLTAKVGDSIINCFDGTYDRYRLKQWSSKGILKCPVCDGDYEYCHGEVVSPYFRHVGKECNGYYSESETDEHREGKLLLYNWIKNQDGVTNCQLESWIPETKQRPDIYFEQNGKKYVIEYQCTPIASEFLIRRELYKLAGINDIWILGTEKYNLDSERCRAIEKGNVFSNGLMYLDVNNKKLMINIEEINKNQGVFNISSKFYSSDNLKYLIDNEFITKYTIYRKLHSNQLDGFIFLEGKIKVIDDIVRHIKLLERNFKAKYDYNKSFNFWYKEFKWSQIKTTENLVFELRDKIKEYSNLNLKIRYKGDTPYYNCAVMLLVDDDIKYAFFVKDS